MYSELDSGNGLLAAWHFNGNADDALGVNHGIPGSGASFVNSDSPIISNLDPLGDEDSDGMLNGDEATVGTDPYDQDSDDDGLGDNDEYLGSTDPLLADTDNDGIQDGTELGETSGWAGDPANGIGGTDTSIFVPDADDTTFTDPNAADTDGGDLADGEEDLNQNGAVDGDDTDPNDLNDDHFSYGVQGLTPGAQATLSSWQCRRHAQVVPLYSLYGAGPIVTPYGFDLALTTPIERLQGSATGNSANTYQTIWVPPFAPTGRTVWWQAVEVWGGDHFRTSNPLATVIQ